jgi:transcriptional regulator with XRE-family HTH domain
MSNGATGLLRAAVPRQEIGNRVYQLRRTFGLTQAELAASLGLLQAYISSIEGGRADIKTGFLLVLANRFPDLNLHWLLTGVGPMSTAAWLRAAVLFAREGGSAL